MTTDAKTELKPHTLTRHDEIAPGVYVIGFKREDSFIPGQVIKLGLGTEQPPRIYSICSGAEEDELCVLFNIKDDGFLTPKLAAMKSGSTVFASAPYGTFLGTDEPAWWIATGTGVAPFASMIRSGQTANKVLVHGVRHLNQFYFKNELAAALAGNMHCCCSAETSEEVFHGRVTTYLNEHPDLPKNQHYFICGQATMAVEVRDLLIAKGVPFGNIHTEIYF